MVRSCIGTTEPRLVSSRLELAAALALSGAGLLLLLMCWRRGVVLGGICAAVGLALGIAAPLGLLARSATALTESATATAIGAVLFALGQFLGRLLDREPDPPS